MILLPRRHINKVQSVIPLRLLVNLQKILEPLLLTPKILSLPRLSHINLLHLLLTSHLQAFLRMLLFVQLQIMMTRVSTSK